MIINSYIIRVLRNQRSLYYFGEVIVNDKKEIQTNYMVSEINAIKSLNRDIHRFNTINGVKLPKFPEIKGYPPIVFDDKTPETSESKDKTKPKASEPVNATAEATEKAAEQRSKQQAEPKKPATPKRKPFTPYGLNGYFVDKNSNIRLLLDRKANSKTITLNPDFFASLAEMVKKTQEYQNETAE